MKNVLNKHRLIVLSVIFLVSLFGGLSYYFFSTHTSSDSTELTKDEPSEETTEGETPTFQVRYDEGSQPATTE